MRSLLSTVLFVILAISLPAWADQNRDFFSEMGEPGSGSTVYHANGAYLGIDTQDITSDRVAPLKLKEERGVEVMMVDQDAPAGKAGIKEHDVILEFNGARVEGCEQLRRMIHETPAGRAVSLGISREGQPVTVQVQLADRAKAMEHAMKLPTMVMPHISVMPRISVMPEIDMPMFDISSHSARAGMQVENLTPQLGEFFGVKGGDGVLVRSVDKGSSAESAGLKAGDVIVRVESEKVANRSEWNMAMRSHNGGKVTLGIIRDKREQNLSLTIPERSKDHSQLWTEPDINLEDFDIDFDRSELREISTAARESAAHIRQEVEKNIGPLRDALKQNKAELDRQLKPQLDQMRRSLEEMRHTLQKSFHEL